MMGPTDPFVERLRREVPEWVRDGLLSEALGQSILARYGTEYERRVGLQRQGRLTQVISALGAVLVGTGVILFVGANWEGISKAGKLAVIFGAIVAADAAGLWLRVRDYARTGTAVLFLGALLYGAGLALVAQIYQLEARGGGLFLLWAVGVLASGLALKSELFLSLSAVLFTAWTFFERMSFDSPFAGPAVTFHLPYLLAAGALVLAAYRFGQPHLLAFDLLGLSVWLGFALVRWHADPVRMLVFYLVLGGAFLVLAVARWAASDRLARPYATFGVIFVLVPTYALSFHAVVRELHRSARPAGATGFWIVLIGLALVTTAGALVLGLATTRFPSAVRFCLLGLAGLVVFALAFLAAPAWPGAALAWNGALAAATLGLIALGYFLQERRFVNTGMAFFVLLVMSRYLDVFALHFGTYGSFMIGGLLFIGLGWGLERFRRQLLKQMTLRRSSAEGAGGAA